VIREGRTEAQQVAFAVLCVSQHSKGPFVLVGAANQDEVREWGERHRPTAAEGSLSTVHFPTAGTRRDFHSHGCLDKLDLGLR